MESGSQSWQSVHEDGERGRAEEGRNVDPENCEDDFMSRFLDRQSRTPVILILTRWLDRQLRRVWAPLEGPVRSVIRFCLLVIGFSLTGVVVFVVIAVVFLVYRIPIAMIVEGIVSLKQPPRLRQQQMINDEVSDHHPDIIYRLGSLYKRRRQKVAVRRRVKTLLAIVLLVVFICLGILKRRAMVLGFDLWLWKWMVLLGVFTCGRQLYLFSDRIVRGGFQLYFLAHICGLYLSILELARNEYIRSKTEKEGSGNGGSERIIEEVIFNVATLYIRRLDVHGDQSMCQLVLDLMKDNTVPIKANLYDLRDIARCFIDLAIVSSGDHNHKDEDIDGLEQRFNVIAPGDVQYITEEDLITVFNFTQADAPLFWQELLWQQLQDNSSQHNSSQLLQVSYSSFKKWMVDVHIRSITLGRTLRDAEGLVNYLNSIINGAIAIMVILVWLLLTGVATTKVLVVIASPFLAATFIFADMCKRVFEGIIFIFVSHPFSVGDTCEIENQKLEVKQMGVLRTKFYKVGTKEEISYANSELASKAIMNLKEDVGLEDQVTLKLDSPTASDSAIQVMKTKIKSFFENDKRRRYASNTEVTTLEVTGNWIMIIKFKHQMARDMTVTKCVELKRKQRSEFLEAVNQMCDETHIKLAVAPT